MKIILIGLALLSSVSLFASDCSITIYENQLGDEKSKISQSGLSTLETKGYYWSIFDGRSYPKTTLSTSYSCSTNFFGFKSCSYSVQIGTHTGNSMRLSNQVSASSIDKALKKLRQCN